MPVDTRINDGHDDAGIAKGLVPGANGVNIRSANAHVAQIVLALGNIVGQIGIINFTDIHKPHFFHFRKGGVSGLHSFQSHGFGKVHGPGAVQHIGIGLGFKIIGHTFVQLLHPVDGKAFTQGVEAGHANPDGAIGLVESHIGPGFDRNNNPILDLAHHRGVFVGLGAGNASTKHRSQQGDKGKLLHELSSQGMNASPGWSDSGTGRYQNVPNRSERFRSIWGNTVSSCFKMNYKGNWSFLQYGWFFDRIC